MTTGDHLVQPCLPFTPSSGRINYIWFLSQGCLPLGHEHLQWWRLHDHSEQSLSLFEYFHHTNNPNKTTDKQSILLYLIGNSSFPICLYCLLPCHLTPLRSVGQSGTLISSFPTWFLCSCLGPTQLPLLQAQQSQISLHLFIWQMIQSLHHLDSLAQTSLEKLRVCLVLASPALNTPAVSRQCWAAEWWSLSSCWPLLPKTPKIPPAFSAHRHTTGFVLILTSTCFSAELLSSRLAPPRAWGYYSPAPELCVFFVYLHKLSCSTILQPVHTPWDVSTTTWCSRYFSFSFALSVNLIRVHTLCPSIQVTVLSLEAP